MGDFSEHILFGFLTVAVIGYLSKDLISLNLVESLASMILVFTGSVLPDIDHENSYVHRSVRAFISISAAATAFYFMPLAIHYRFAAGSAAFLIAFQVFSALRPRHRGFIHSRRFAFYTSATALSLSALGLGTLVPGLAFAAGILSHLLLDGELF